MLLTAIHGPMMGVAKSVCRAADRPRERCRHTYVVSTYVATPYVTLASLGTTVTIVHSINLVTVAFARMGVMVQQRGFGNLEAVVMERIWCHMQPVTVREIFDELVGDRRIAYTTVMSTMDNLHRKQWLERTRIGKAYEYWPTMTREERSARLMRAALEAGGNSDAVLTHFLQQMSPEESEQLAEALRRVGSEGPKL